MDEKNYRYRNIIPEEREKVTKEWKVKGERKTGNTEIYPEEEKTGPAAGKDNSEREETGNIPDGKKKREKAEKIDMDATIEDARDSVKKAIGDVVDLGNTLLGTQKGREHIEKKAKKAGKKLTKALEYIIEDAGKKLKK